MKRILPHTALSLEQSLCTKDHPRQLRSKPSRTAARKCSNRQAAGWSPTKQWSTKFRWLAAYKIALAHHCQSLAFVTHSSFVTYEIFSTWIGVLGFTRSISESEILGRHDGSKLGVSLARLIVYALPGTASWRCFNTPARSLISFKSFSASFCLIEASLFFSSSASRFVYSASDGWIINNNVNNASATYLVSLRLLTCADFRANTAWSSFQKSLSSDRPWVFQSFRWGTVQTLDFHRGSKCE